MIAVSSLVALCGKEGLPEVRWGEGDAEKLASGAKTLHARDMGVAGSSTCSEHLIEFRLLNGDGPSTKSLISPVGLVEHLKDTFLNSRRRVPWILLVHEEDVQGACAQHED